MNGDTNLQTVFITGATGFIGQELVRMFCRAGVAVRALVRSPARAETLSDLPVELVEGDLDSESALRAGCRGVDAVFHLAGLTQELHRGDFYRVNTEATIRFAALVCDEAKSGKPPVFVYVSSQAASGVGIRLPERLGYRPRAEEDLPNPPSPYGRSKWLAERKLTFLANELPISVVRPAFVFGQRDMNGLSLVRIAKNSFFFFTPGYRDRDFSFIHVEDLVRVLQAVAQRGERLSTSSFRQITAAIGNKKEDTKNDKKYCSARGVYFAAAPEFMPLSQYGHLLAEAAGRKKFHHFRTPPAAVWCGAFGVSVLNRLTKKASPFDMNKAIEAMSGPWICSSEKAIQQLKISFDVPLAVRIQQTVDWFEQAGLL